MSSCSPMRRLRASHSRSTSCWGALKTSSPGSILPMTPTAWNSWLLSATNTPRRTKMPKLAGFWRKPTRFRDDSRKHRPCGGLVLSGGGSGSGWRTAARGGSLPGRTARTCPDHNTHLDRIFCLRQGSEVAQERGDSQAGFRMQAVQGYLKQSPFRLRHAGVARVNRVGRGLPRGRAESAGQFHFRAGGCLVVAPGADDTQTAVVIFNDWALALGRLGRPWKRRDFFAVRLTSVAPDRRKRPSLRYSLTTMPRRFISWVVSKRRPTIPNGPMLKRSEPAIRW